MTRSSQRLTQVSSSGHIVRNQLSPSYKGETELGEGAGPEPLWRVSVSGRARRASGCGARTPSGPAGGGARAGAGGGPGGGAARGPGGCGGGLASPDKSGSEAAPEPAMEQPRKAVVVTGTLMAAAATATAGRGGLGGSRAGGVGRARWPGRGRC